MMFHKRVFINVKNFHEQRKLRIKHLFDSNIKFATLLSFLSIKTLIDPFGFSAKLHHKLKLRKLHQFN